MEKEWEESLSKFLTTLVDHALIWHRDETDLSGDKNPGRRQTFKAVASRIVNFKII